MAQKKKTRVLTGIAGAALSEVERQVPAGEPEPWPESTKLAVIGKPTPRVDGRLKVTGAAQYTADIQLPNMLYARVVRSPHPHAKIKSIDISAAKRAPGVRAVHVLDHLRGSAELRSGAENKLKYPVVRYIGQPLAAVAASTQAEADEAARLVKVEYELLPFVVELEAARATDAPLVYPGPTEQKGTAGGGGAPKGLPQKGNIRGPAKTGSPGLVGPPLGDAIAALESAEVVVEGTYRTEVQTHSTMETHGVVADYRRDGITVYASTQGTSTVRDEIAEVFSVPKSKIRVITEFMGGGFGAKFGIGNFGVLALHLSKQAGAPVRLMLDRREEHLAVGNRPSSVQTLRVGAKKDGTLTAIHLVAYGTGGVATGAGTSGPAKNLYACPNVLCEEYDVYTNAGPAAAFRAPGHPQGAFALEQTIDELAEKLGVDPLVLRDKIDAVEERGQPRSDALARKRERELGALKIGWKKRSKPGAERGTIKRGIGFAQAIWYRIVDLDSACEVRVSRDGSVEVLSAVQDIGTGTRTVLAQVVAEELGLRPEQIDVRIGDTNYPVGPASGGSRTTNSLTPAARNAAAKIREKLFTEGVTDFRRAAAKMKTEQIAERASREDDYGGTLAPLGGKAKIGIDRVGGVQFAEIAVDTETGIIKVEKIVAVHDAGRILNPLTTTSQIHGGVLQGISYALYEQRVLDRQTGHMLNSNFETYKILGARETPVIEVELIEQYYGRSSTDAGSIGEPATVPTAAAIANAFYNATGVRMRELPMTPARVLKVLESGGRV